MQIQIFTTNAKKRFDFVETQCIIIASNTNTRSDQIQKYRHDMISIGKSKYSNGISCFELHDIRIAYFTSIHPVHLNHRYFRIVAYKQRLISKAFSTECIEPTPAQLKWVKLDSVVSRLMINWSLILMKSTSLTNFPSELTLADETFSRASQMSVINAVVCNNQITK